MDATHVRIRIDNRTCGDNASLTAMFHNITESVLSYSLAGQPGVISGVKDETWSSTFDQTIAKNSGGLKADGFGHFDSAIYDGANSDNPNGGNKADMRSGEIFEFTMNAGSAFDLCGFLTEVSQPTPGNRNRNVVGRWQACGPNEGNSRWIGPCEPDDVLFAVLDEIVLLPSESNMRVEWSTSLEINNLGFNVLRREATRGGWAYVNADLVVGQGDTVSGAEYAFDDKTAVNGVEYMYRIEDIDFNGRLDLSEIRRDVTNPANPRIQLTRPAYGATVDLNTRPRFAFANNGAHGHMIMQISGDPTFSGDSIVSTHVSGRFGSSGVTLGRRTARLAGSLARDNDGIVYWRIVDRNRAPVSDTFRLEVQENDRIDAGPSFRAGGKR